MDESVTYPSWDIFCLQVPVRSKLISLIPLGMGTPLVESFTSYIRRLAEEHSVSSFVLCKYILEPILRETEIYKSRGFVRKSMKSSGSLIYWSHRFNGVSNGAKAIVKIVESLTNVKNLTALTFLNWSDVILDLKFLRRNKAWCSYCYGQWRKKGEIIYEPLIWNIEVIKICLKHFTPLEEHCHHCKKAIVPLTSNYFSDYCLHCKRWLGKDKYDQNLSKNDVINIEFEYQRWLANSFGDLIAKSVTLSTIPTKESVRRIIEEIILRLADGSTTAFSKQVRMDYFLINHWRKKKSFPSINSLIELSYQTKLPLVNLLLGLSSMDEVDWQNIKDTIKIPKPIKNVVFLDDKLELLKLALTEEPPPSLKAVANRLGYLNYKPVFKIDRELCRIIAQRFKNHKNCSNSPKTQRLSKLDREVRYENCYKTLKKETNKECPRPIEEISKELKIDLRWLYLYFRNLCFELTNKRREYKKALNIKYLNEIHSKLKEAMQITPPLSLTEIAKNYGIRPFLIKQHFKTEHKIILNKRKKESKNRISKLKKELEIVLQSNNPVSLRQLSKQLSCSPCTLYEHFPALSKDLSEKYRKHKTELIKTRREEIKKRIREVIINISIVSPNPTYYQIRRYLSKAALKNGHLFTILLKEVRQELGLI